MVLFPDPAVTRYQIEYLDQAAASDPGRGYKTRLLGRPQDRVKLNPALLHESADMAMSADEPIGAPS